MVGTAQRNAASGPRPAATGGGRVDEALVNYRVRDRDLKYYIFDWDDNILRMPTRIHLERRTAGGAWEPQAVSTSMFALVRNDTQNYRPPHGDWEKAFVEFRDHDPAVRSTFLRDTERALAPVIGGEATPPASFGTFRQTLVEGRLFAIVTARGHSRQTIRRGVEYFIEHVLSPAEKREMLRSLRGYLHCFEPERAHLTDDEVLKNYLDLNRYHPVTSPEFQSAIGARDAGSQSPERAKQLAIRDFVSHVISILRRIGLQRPVSIGFSDDDPGNVRAVEDYMRRELAREFPGISFVVYDTSDPKMPSGRKIVVNGQLKLKLEQGA